MSVASEVFSLLYFFVPAYVANMSAVYARRYDIFDVPLDAGIHVFKKRLFGKNKTLRGLIFGMLGGQLAFLAQVFLAQFGIEPSLFSYTQLPLLLGGLIGFGSLMGDAVESFFKRQLNIAPGQKLVVWDQIDFVLGAGLVTLGYWSSSVLAFSISLAIILVVTVLVQRIAFSAGIKDDPL